MRVFALKNTLIEDSASGAAFPTIIDAVYKLDNDNEIIIVYGVVFDENHRVIHRRIENIDDYSLFRGSKYVISYLGDTFINIEDDLKRNRVVIFSGTPCQVAALLRYLAKKSISTQKLITVDLICHGTPNSDIWKDYVLWIEKKYRAKLKSFTFRYSKAKWREYPVKATFDNGKTYVNTYYLRQYTQLYLKKIMLRECCYLCKFTNLNRNSDITIGDFWGINNVMPQFPFKTGVSEVLENTEKGKRILDKISMLAKEDKGIILEECLSKEYLKYQHNLNSPTLKPQNTECFRNDYKNFGFEYVLKKYGDHSLLKRVRHYYRKIRGELFQN